MTRIVRIRLTLEVPDDVDIQVNRDDEPTVLAVETEEPPLFEGLPTTPIIPLRPPEDTPHSSPGPDPICPRHKKSREGKGGYFCPTVISGPGVDPKVWCDWRVKIG